VGAFVSGTFGDTQIAGGWQWESGEQGRGKFSSFSTQFQFEAWTSCLSTSNKLPHSTSNRKRKQQFVMVRTVFFFCYLS